ncbi:MAG: zinc-dependent metalloprotease family protein [Woeseia sp.]
MKAIAWILAGAVLGLSSTPAAAESGDVSVSHFEPIERLSIDSASLGASDRLSAAGPVSLGFDALGQSFDLRLEPNSGLLSGFALEALPGGIEVYRGRMAGKADSWARIVVFQGMPRGLVWDGRELYAIEAPGDSVVPTASPIIYRLADTVIAPGSMSCAAGAMSGNGAASYQKLIGELGGAISQAPGAVEEIDIGAVGDFEFTSAQGGDAAAAAAITTRLNNVDGIYSQQLGVQINVPVIDTFSTSTDPFSDTNDAAALLGELADYRETTPAQTSLGLTHLYTGRALAGATVGIAFTSELCSPRFGAGLSEGRSNATFDSLVAAHEIGHNFGAPHDGVPGSACESEPLTFIMAPSMNGSNQFSQCSITQMSDDIAAAACITPLPTVDLTIALNGQAPTALLGNFASLTFDIGNRGTLQGTNVQADITLPGNVSFVSASASTGSCTEAAGTVNCLLGDVPGTSGQTVTVSTLTTAVGVGTFDATVTADFDERPGNNQDSVQLTVDPAVDLVVNAPAATQITLNGSTAIGVLLENRSVLDATGVTLSISLASGLRADTASWPAGSCTVAAQQVDCQAGSFGNLSNSSLNLGVTGLTAGVKSYTITLASTEADTDPANNSINSTVTVNDPNAPARSGGGAVGLPLLCLLGWTAFLARRRSTGI